MADVISIDDTVKDGFSVLVPDPELFKGTISEENVEQFSLGMDSITPSGVSYCVDLSGFEYLNASTGGVLLTFSKKLPEDEKLHVIITKGSIRRLYSMLGFNDFFQLYESREQFIRSG